MNDFSYEILDVLKKYDGDRQAALFGEKDPRVLYALSPQRENLVEWMEFPKDARILQIGSDYGSVTGVLAGKAGELTVLDGRDENLAVGKERCGGLSNVRFIRGEGLDIRPTAEKFREFCPADGASPAAELMARPFDAVILAGFLEMFKKEQAAEIFEWAAGFLKAGGTLAIAAENNFGVRYWMGAKEYETAFLEAEFRGLFSVLTKKHGGSLRMYYPVPDYRYPVTVYSDDRLPGTGDVANISARLESPGLWFGDEEEIMVRACQNGEFTKFTNSFLGVWEKGTV